MMTRLGAVMLVMAGLTCVCNPVQGVTVTNNPTADTTLREIAGLNNFGVATAPGEPDPQRNLAFGKRVMFLPSTRSDGAVAGTALTDGKIIEAPERDRWFGEEAVRWFTAGRANLCVDLGETRPIDEVAMRLLGGSPWGKTSAICVPGWFEVLVSDNLRGPWYKVAEYSKWRPGDREKYGIPRNAGEPFVFRLRFRQLKTAGRYVGIRFACPSWTLSDELFVFRGNHDPGEVARDPRMIADFSVTDVQLYFHKPRVRVTSNIVTPLPVGCVGVEADAARDFTVVIEVPEGVSIPAGWLYAVQMDKAAVTQGNDKTTVYTWRFPTSLKLPRKHVINQKGSDLLFGRLWLTGKPVPGAKPEIRYRAVWGDYASPVVVTPLDAVEVPAPPIRPKRLMTTLSGWFNFDHTRQWPDWEKAYRHIGFNTMSGRGPYWMMKTKNEGLLAEIAAFAAQSRQKGFKIHLFDDPWHPMWQLAPDNTEIRCQFEDGRTGWRVCPSYRGRFYKEELERRERAFGLFKPDVLSFDIELWSDGCVDPPTCTRCRQDKEKSGIAAWEDWKTAKGEEMWRDLHDTIQRAVSAGGGPTPRIGSYKMHAGVVYHTVWPFDRLYPELMQNSQPRHYSPMEPYHISMTGDLVREDRRQLRGSDVVNWLGSGMFGTFSGEAFYCSLLESFCNGARGVLTFSTRLIDADMLVGYARAIRAMAPVEDIILDGDLIDNAAVSGPGRVSGMRRGDDIVLLAADYFGDADGTVKVKLGLDRQLRVLDLDTGAELGKVGPGRNAVLEVPLGQDRAKPLYLRP